MKELLKSLYQAPIVKKGSYNYVIHPLTDGIPQINPLLLKEVVEIIAKDFPDCTRIVTIEAMGIPIATALSLQTGIPFTIIRKRRYGLPDEKEVRQKTGYSETTLYINGLTKDDKIVIVDDVLSTGGTLIAVVDALKAMNITIAGIFIIINKGDRISVERHIGQTITTLVDIVVNDEVTIIHHR